MTEVELGSLGEANSSRRNKLGVALAGGGFRASLFHMGVLRRMAELDLLRYVEALSTVSGGSIIGALYLLILKKYLDRSKKGRLSREQYIKITRDVEQILVAGIQKNLRTRLFMNPLGVLSVLLTEESLGKRMARIYERYLYLSVSDGDDDGGCGGRPRVPSGWGSTRETCFGWLKPCLSCWRPVSRWSLSSDTCFTAFPF